MNFTRLLCLASLVFTALLLAGCDTIAPGYLNRLSYKVTIVERPAVRTLSTFTLAPGQFTQPGFGRSPRSFDVLRSDGRLVAQHRLSDLSGTGVDFYHYIVIDARGAHIETRPSMLE